MEDLTLSTIEEVDVVVEKVLSEDEKLEQNRLEMEQVYKDMFKTKDIELNYKTEEDKFIWEHLPLTVSQKKELLLMIEKNL